MARHSKSLVDSDGGAIKAAMHNWEKTNFRTLLPDQMESFFKSLKNYGTIFQPNEDEEEFILTKHFFLTGKI